MSFASVIDAYCKALGRTNREIAAACDISPAALSRYRNGERTPELGSDAVERLIAGFTELTNEDGIEFDRKSRSIRESIEGSLASSKILGMSYGARLNALMSLLGLHNADVARLTDVSPSHVSRIRSGQRMPANQRGFARKVAQQASERCVDMRKVGELVELIDAAGEMPERNFYDLDSQDELANVIEQWLLGSNIVESDLDAVVGLLEKLNDFYFSRELELLERLEPIELAADSQDEFARFYTGIAKMREAELTFFEIAAGHAVSEVYLSNDMPMLEMAIDPAYSASYRVRVGSLIRRGCHVVVIHSLERPLTETVMALEFWLPLYLTGQVTPLYLRGAGNRTFFHVNYVCDACALAAEAVRGHQVDGRYYLTTCEEDLSYYRRKMGFILERVSSMLEIYREGDAEQLKQFRELEVSLEAKGTGYVVADERFENLHIVSYPGNCVVVTINCEPSIHIIIRHPKLLYALSHL